MTTGGDHDRFSRALDALVSDLRRDRSVLAALLCGSLAHDTVWARSDIDLVLVVADEPITAKAAFSHLSLDADGVNVHAMLLSRQAFRRIVEGAEQSTFMHSFLSKGRLLYSHDPTIATLAEGLRALGERDLRYQLLRAATSVLGPLAKAQKWLVTRDDANYAALWILYAATPLAQVEVLSARQIVDREVIPQALALNPPFFRSIYVDLLNHEKTAPRVRSALSAIEGYLAARARSAFAPVFDYLAEAGETRSVTEIEDHFCRTLAVEGVTLACEYLADEGLIGRASLPARVTRRSTVTVQEIAFFDVGAGRG